MNSQVLRAFICLKIQFETCSKQKQFEITKVIAHNAGTNSPKYVSMYCVIPIKTFDQNSKMNEHTFGFFFVWVSCSVSNFVVSYIYEQPHASCCDTNTFSHNFWGVQRKVAVHGAQRWYIAGENQILERIQKGLTREHIFLIR